MKATFENHGRPIPDYLHTWMTKKNNLRKINGGGLFQSADHEYDAFEEDVAVVNFYFDAGSVVQYVR